MPRKCPECLCIGYHKMDCDIQYNEEERDMVTSMTKTCHYCNDTGFITETTKCPCKEAKIQSQFKRLTTQRNYGPQPFHRYTEIHKTRTEVV